MGKTTNTASSLIRFGKFEADPQTSELRCDGARVPLQQQPFQVLVALLARPGQLVSREELRELIWNDGTFVDFERGLNKAMNRLREALGDSAGAPRFVETLPKRGYRFVAPILPADQSIAVLPFQNLSGDPDQEHWADGLASELMNGLASLPGVRVVSRLSTLYFRTHPAPLPEIALRLSADWIVEGSVAIRAREIRIAVQLVHARQDGVLWATTYQEDLDDVFAVQRQIARAIAQEVRARISLVESRRPEAPAEPKAEAFEACLKGRHFFEKKTAEGLNAALRYFRRAVAQQADYAVAYAGMADSYVMQGILGLASPRQVFPKAKTAVEKALELNGGLADAYKTLGHIRMAYDWDWSEAGKEFQRAIQIDTNHAAARQNYGILLTIVGRNQEAIAELEAARHLDPLSLSANSLLGFVHMRARNYDRAIQACRSAIELHSGNPFGHWILARVYDACGEYNKAVGEAREAMTLSKESLQFASQLGYACARTGDHVAACRIADELVSTSKKKYVSPYLIAMIYVGLGDRVRAFEWLGKSLMERSARMSELLDPPFDGLRTDRRFERLTRGVGLRSL
ncbi:MAG: winged helix-turn-helix domain-containing protein [Bryobacteraceae bacterium]